MTDEPDYSVGDVALRGDVWQFALHGAHDCGPIFFAFASRKEANVSRRLMKEIVTRTVDVPPGGEAPPPVVPISWGELIDKVTILEIKCDRIEHDDALRNIRYELSVLDAAAGPLLAANREIAKVKSKLKSVNEKLWEIENSLREKEARREFDARFVELARSVYKTNDERSALKKAINIALKSVIVEEKSYSPRDAGRT